MDVKQVTEVTETEIRMSGKDFFNLEISMDVVLEESEPTFDGILEVLKDNGIIISKKEEW